MSVSKETLFSVLDRCGDEINSSISNPNHGGCGVIAAIVAKELKQLGVPVEVVTPHYKGTYRRHPRPATVAKRVKRVTNKSVDDAGLNRGHLAVRFKVNGRLFTWDSNGRRSGKLMGNLEEPCAYPFGKGLPVEVAEKLANQEKGWNSSFNRRQIPKIRSIVEEAFRDV